MKIFDGFIKSLGGKFFATAVFCACLAAPKDAPGVSTPYNCAPGTAVNSIAAKGPATGVTGLRFFGLSKDLSSPNNIINYSANVQNAGWNSWTPTLTGGGSSQYVADVSTTAGATMVISKGNKWWKGGLSSWDTGSLPSSSSTGFSSPVIRRRLIAYNGIFYTTQNTSSNEILVRCEASSCPPSLQPAATWLVKSFPALTPPENRTWYGIVSGVTNNNIVIVMATDGSVVYETPGGWSYAGVSGGPSSTYAPWVELEYFNAFNNELLGHNVAAFYAMSEDGHMSTSTTGIGGWTTPTKIYSTVNPTDDVTATDFRIGSFRATETNILVQGDHGFMKYLMASYYDVNDYNKNGIFWSIDGGQNWRFAKINSPSISGNRLSAYNYNVIMASESNGAAHIEIDKCTVTCLPGQGKGAGSQNNSPTTCSPCADKYYSPDISDSCVLCPNAQNGGTVGTWNTDHFPPDQYGSTAVSMCYEQMSYTATHCSGTKKCPWINARPSGAYNCGTNNIHGWDFTLTSCPAGYWGNNQGTSPTPIDGICVGTAYYSPNGSLQKTLCTTCNPLHTETSGACIGGSCSDCHAPGCPLGQGKGTGSRGNGGGGFGSGLGGDDGKEDNGKGLGGGEIGTKECTDCDDGYYSNDETENCYACPNAQNGGTPHTWNTGGNPPSPYGSTSASMCYELAPYLPRICSGTQKCPWTGTKLGAYNCASPNAWDYELTSCPCGYWAPNPGPRSSPIDGECVGQDYWSANGDITRTQCVKSKPPKKTSGCGAGACASTDCKGYITLHNSQSSVASILRDDPSIPLPRLGVRHGTTNYYCPLDPNPIAGAIRVGVPFKDTAIPHSPQCTWEP